MTNVIELAKQAGCEIRNGHAYNQNTGSLDQMLKRFAKLVRNAALEEAAVKCERRESALSELMPKGLCADYFNSGAVSASKRNAAAIRNLKEPTPFTTKELVLMNEQHIHASQQAKALKEPTP